MQVIEWKETWWDAPQNFCFAVHPFLPKPEPVPVFYEFKGK